MTPEIADPITQQEGEVTPEEAQEEQSECGNCISCGEALEEEGTCPNTCGNELEGGPCSEHLDGNGNCPKCDENQEVCEGPDPESTSNQTKSTAPILTIQTSEPTRLRQSKDASNFMPGVWNTGARTSSN